MKTGQIERVNRHERAASDELQCRQAVAQSLIVAMRWLPVAMGPFLAEAAARFCTHALTVGFGTPSSRPAAAHDRPASDEGERSLAVAVGPRPRTAAAWWCPTVQGAGGLFGERRPAARLASELDSAARHRDLSSEHPEGEATLEGSHGRRNLDGDYAPARRPHQP
jgi:hypothetical protein